MAIDALSGVALGAVAALELLPGAAPAGVVAAELLVLVDHALLDDRRRLELLLGRRVGPRGAAGGARRGHREVVRPAHAARVGHVAARGGGPPGGARRDRAVAVLALHLDLDVEDHAREVRPDGVHQVLEQRVGLVLVRDKRVDLGKAAQVDALAQVVHVVEVLAPALIDDLQEQVALERAHELGPELLLALLVERAGVVGELLDELLAVDGVGVELGDVHARRPDVLDGDEQAVEIPVLDEVAGRVLLDHAGDDLGDLLAGRLAHVAPHENLVAVLVDDLALLVHDVVVLEDALADEEVLLLDLLLGLLDLLRQHPGLDGLLVALLVGGAEAVEDLVDPVAGEEAHEVVLGAEEEAGLTRVPLAAGAAPQLVVDAARLVALGAADEQAAGLHDLLAVLFDPRLDLGEDLGVALLVVGIAG